MSLVKYNDEIASLAENPKVRERLNRTDGLILDRSNVDEIAVMSDKELQKIIGEMMPYLFRDIGINRKPDGYDGTRFFQVLRRYCSDLTMSEVKLAFEMLQFGDLDEYLKDKNHYQQFSLEYVGKVIQAYRRRKDKVLIKARKALPEPQKTFNIEEHNKEVEGYINGLYAEYLETGEFRGLNPYMVLDRLRELGHDVDFVVEARDYIGNFRATILEVENRYEKDRIKKDMKQGRVDGKVKVNARRNKAKEKVLGIFKQLKEQRCNSITL